MHFDENIEKKTCGIVLLLCYSDLCTEQLISLRSLAAKIAQRYISAIRYINVNDIVPVRASPSRVPRARKRGSSERKMGVKSTSYTA